MDGSLSPHSLRRQAAPLPQEIRATLPRTPDLGLITRCRGRSGHPERVEKATGGNADARGGISVVTAERRNTLPQICTVPSTRADPLYTALV